MKSRHIYICLFVSLALGLAGCGKSGSTSESSDVISNSSNQEIQDISTSSGNDDVDEFSDNYEYTLDEVSDLDGAFICHKDKHLTMCPRLELFCTVKNFTTKENYDDPIVSESNDGTTMIFNTSAPENGVIFDQNQDDTLILVGKAGEGILNGNFVSLIKLDFGGYGNPAVDLDPSEMEDISGDDIFKLKYIPCGTNDDKEIILSNKQNGKCNYGYYEGTQYMTFETEMWSTFYFSTPNSNIDLDIHKTKNGYFYLDLSSVEPGSYRLYTHSGEFLITIK